MRGWWLTAAALSAACADGGAGELGGPALGVVEHPENRRAVSGLGGSAEGPLGGPDAQRFVVVDAELRFVAAPDFEAPRDADGDGRFELTLGASPVALTVALVDVDEPPVFGSAREATVEEGRTAVTAPSATDPEGTPVDLRIGGGPDAAAFALGGDGRLAFVAAPDFERPADADADNVYRLRLEASDAGGLAAGVDFAVRVQDRPEGPEPRLEVLFPRGELTTAAASVAVLVELTGASARAEVELLGPSGAQPLSRSTRDRWRGRLERSAGDVEVRARDGGRELRASIPSPFARRVLGRPVAAGGGWLLDAEGPRALQIVDGRVRREVRLPALVPRDIEGVPGADAAWVLAEDAVLRVDAAGAARRLELPPFDDARAIAPLPGGQAALVLDRGALHRVEDDPPRRQLVAGEARGAGPGLSGAVDVTTDGALAFVHLPGAARTWLLAVDLGTGDRRQLAEVGPTLGALGLARASAVELLALSGPRLSRVEVRSGRVLDALEVLDELGRPLTSGRLGEAAVAGEAPVLARALPPLVAPIEGSPPRVRRRFDVVGEGPPLAAIDALAMTPDGALGVLARGQLARLDGRLTRVTRALELPAPSAFAPLAEGAALVADRDRDRLLLVTGDGGAQPLPDPAASLARGLQAPVAVGAASAQEAWVIDAAPPALFRFDATGWSLPFPEADLGFPAVASFGPSATQAYLLSSVQDRLTRLDLRTGALVRLEGEGPSLMNARALAVSADGVFALDAAGQVVGVDLDTGARRLVSGATRGVGDPIESATAIAADGRGRVFVGRADGGVMLVELGSGDRTFVAR